MKYGLLTYAENNSFFNIGDYIQSLAAKQFLPQVDRFINREKLSQYKDENVKLIMNGWFTHNIRHWIPSGKIIPLFVSFHINNTASPFLLNEKGVSYLKKHEPIGCRDGFTVEILKEKGIEAYFTGCLTLTLDSYKVDDSLRTDKIYIVDPLYGYVTRKKIMNNYKAFLKSIWSGKIFELGKRSQHIKKIIDKNILKNAVYINHEPKAGMFSQEEKFKMAEDLLNQYARAKLVITSRIHCALPCLALGTPVVFINGFDDFVDSCRFDGILDLFNRIDIDAETGQFKANFALNGKITKNLEVKNPEKYQDLANKLKDCCKKFINSDRVENKQ